MAFNCYLSCYGFVVYGIGFSDVWLLLFVVVFCLLLWFKLIVLVCICLNSLSGAYVFCLVLVVDCLFICLFLFLVVWCLLVFFV